MKRIKKVENDSDYEDDHEKPLTKISKPSYKLLWHPSEVLKDICDGNESTSRKLCEMLDDGDSIPFIARYRRNFTNEMDPDKLRFFQENYEALKRIQEKSLKIIAAAEKKGSLPDSVRKSLLKAKSEEELELLGAPYKTASKQTLAARAKALGLEEIALRCLNWNGFSSADLMTYIDKSVKGKSSLDEVKTGVSHIITDIIVHDPDTINLISRLQKDSKIIIQSARASSSVSTKKKNENRKLTKDDGSDKYENYFQFSCPLAFIKPHQVLALNRGEKEKALSVKVVLPDWFFQQYEKYCKHRWMENRNNITRIAIIQFSIEDGFKRLVQPLVCRRIRSELTKTAEKSAIDVFASNLRQLLLTPPHRGSVILGIDPGFKNGCKMAVISGDNGDVLDTGIFYLNRSNKAEVVKDLLSKYSVDTIAVGNGTACRETETLVSEVIKGFSNLVYTIVNEQGASIYSCSKSGLEEFPGMDTNIISAVSIARRLRDPLAEYVKIEPKHLGVGMYQHDVSESTLKKTLEEIVVECVSFVGLDLNSAPLHLLEKVAGLNKSTARAIVDRRQKHEKFRSREELMAIKGIGKKVFQQCAGFIKILPSNNGKIENPLDSTLIHPESYQLAEKIIKYEGFKMFDIGKEKFHRHFQQKYEKKNYRSDKFDPDDASTVDFIYESLSRKDNDIRAEKEKPLFRRGLSSINDVKVGTVLSGKVLNVTHFGAFVDLGLGTDGLIHVSKMKNQKIDLGRKVDVKIISLEKAKKKIGLEFIKFS